VARKKNTGRFEGIGPNAPLWKILSRGLFGDLDGTSGERVAEWVRLDKERQALLARTYQPWKPTPMMSTCKARRWLETWFADATGSDGELAWNIDCPPESIHILLARPEEMAFRREVAELHAKARSRHKYLAAQTRDALLNLDADYFRHMAAMIERIKRFSQDGVRPANRAEHAKHVICLIAAEERSRADALAGKPSSGMNGTMPHQGALTLSELRAEMVRRLGGGDYEDDQGHQRILRRWCHEVEYVLKKAPRGRPKAKN
jgi:hypothetical protein